MIRFLYIFIFSIVFAYCDIKEINSFKANFRQTLHSGENDIVYNGNIIGMSPYYVLWNYETPVAKQIYINKDSMIIFEPKLKQAIVSHLQDGLDILSLIKKAKYISDNKYESDILGQKYDLYFKDGILNSIYFEDSLQNKVEIQFSDIEINVDIKLDLFEFKPSSEIDIIYN